MPGQRALVLQSHRSDALDSWLGACVESVRQWSAHRGYQYCFVDDKIFSLLPDGFRHKFAGRAAMLSDYARLLALTQALRAGWQQVFWLDADLLVFDPDNLQPEPAADCTFGLETWIDNDKRGRLRTWRSVHNAFMQFANVGVVLPYLVRSIARIGARIDPLQAAPQTFGPKLLSALHNISPFDLAEQVGAFSPPVLADIAAGGGAYLAEMIRQQPCSPVAANLCASLGQDSTVMQRACERLLNKPGLVSTV